MAEIVLGHWRQWKKEKTGKPFKTWAYRNRDKTSVTESMAVKYNQIFSSAAACGLDLDRLAQHGTISSTLLPKLKAGEIDEATFWALLEGDSSTTKGHHRRIRHAMKAFDGVDWKRAYEILNLHEYKVIDQSGNTITAEQMTAIQAAMTPRGGRKRPAG